jgi:putative PIN family toxin of toxin-antitoxin system
MRHASGGGRLRVVLDTNVYISAFLHPERPIFRLVQQAARRQYHLLMSPAIVGEVGRVMRDELRWEEDVRIRHLKILTRAGEIIVPNITLRVIPEDPDDDRILECAVEGEANLIVSGDRHLRRLRVYQGIPIVQPTDFLRTLGAW